MRKLKGLFVFFSVSLVFSTAPLPAQSGPQFQLPADPDTVVLSYTETPDLILDADSTPRVRVYADGRVLVHFPVYMKRAGDYTLQLDTGEFNRLLAATAGAIGFDRAQAAQARREEQAARFAANGQLRHRSDEVLETIDIMLTGYRPGAATSMRPVDERVEWRDIGPTASEFPGLPGIQGLARARTALLELTEHPGLQRVASDGRAHGSGS